MISSQLSPKQQHISPQQPHLRTPKPNFLNTREGNSHIFAKTGHWSNDQKIRYLIFLQYFQSKLTIKQKRRSWKVFKIMSQFIQTRKPNQCRNHHEKMESYFQSIRNIIEYYKEKIPQYQQYYEAYQQQLKNIGTSSSLEIIVLKQEESISNNDPKVQIQELGKHKKTVTRRLSIERRDQSALDDIKDKDLPKTDHSLRDFPQDIEEKKEENWQKPKMSYSFVQEEFVPSQIYAQEYFNNYSLLRMRQNSFPPAPMNNFFSLCGSRSQNDDEYKEWMECQKLFVQWKSMYERLAQTDE